MMLGAWSAFEYAVYRRIISVFPNAKKTIDNPLVLNKLSVYAR